jgi:hypothetical protein
MKTMKRIIFCMLVPALIFLTDLSAQNPNLERLNAYKIGFITKRLNLTSQEAEKFWPIYNDFQDKKNKIQLERIEINRNFNQNELNMSDREMSEAAERIVNLEMREAELAREFHDKIKTVLSPVKILRLYQAENQYRIQLLKELQERNQTKKNN